MVNNKAWRENAKLAYLLALAVALFAVRDPVVLGALLVLQIMLWLGARLPPRGMLVAARRLLLFTLLIALSFAFVSADPGGDRWVGVPLGAWTLRINVGGLLIAAILMLRVLVLVLASAWVQQSGAPGALVRGLRWLRLPESVAITVDATLALIAGGAGMGGGDGSGGGGGRRQPGAGEIRWQDVRAGRIELFIDVLERALERGRRWLAERYPGLPSERVRDLSIVLALSLTVMGLKVLQVLPGIPIASGHKNVLIVPLFLYVAHATGMRFGGFAAGTAVGIVSFLMGYGKYGVLEIAHFAVPGLLADLLMPLIRAEGGVRRLAQFAVAGGILGLGRFTANVLAILLAGAPQAAWIVFAPMLISQIAFGALSCFVSVLLIKPKSMASEPIDSGSAINRL